jgi:hypothetical protein
LGSVDEVTVVQIVKNGKEVYNELFKLDRPARYPS